MYHKTLADGFFIFACLAIFSAMIGWAVGDIWLASTQWLLIAIVLILFAMYIKMNAEDDEKIIKSLAKVKPSKSKTKAGDHQSFKLTRE